MVTAMRGLKKLPRVIEPIDVPEEQKTCPCCGDRMRGPLSTRQNRDRVFETLTTRERVTD